MAVQFAGSGSTGNRRRRRLVASGDGTGIDASLMDGDGSEMESQLVASAAAGPWVPASETRIWICAAIIGVFLAGLTFALSRPHVFHAEIAPLTNHLLVGTHPLLAVGVQTVFMAMSAHLGILISWYRARCRLDFAGRYRIWPWATGLFAIAAFCMATSTHRPFGEVIHRTSLLSWRGPTVAWLLPFCLAALPITLWVDRDMRNCRSSLYAFRTSVILGVIAAWLEIYQPELQSQSWFRSAYLLTPMFASASLFIAMWLHARVVAYVCPDPPELDEQSAWSTLSGAFRWVGSRLFFWRRNADESADDDAKPRRRRKKTEAEETATKRKRKAPVKRTTARTRTRVKPQDTEDTDESADASDDETESTNDQPDHSSSQSDQSWETTQERWDEEFIEPEPAPPRESKPKGNGRVTYVDEGHGSSVPAPASRRNQQSWKEASQVEQQPPTSANDSEDETDDDRQFQLDSGMTADQMKGMSKRQKRELKKQLRDQERARGR